MNTKKRPIPEFITLNKLGDATLIYVRQSQKAKRITIRIGHEKIELIIPNNNFKKAQDFLFDKESWIRKKTSNAPKTNY
jgi:predicted metal-dependent hydrolase